MRASFFQASGKVALIFALLAMCVLAARAEPAATATISPGRISLGDSAQLTISVSGAGQINPPQGVAVDGLDIRLVGHSQSMRNVNGRTSINVDLNYSVEPRRAGNFAIPGIELEVDGRRLRTQPVTLAVQGAPTSGAGTQGEARVAFAQLDLPKQTAYVGEVIPVELRLYIDARYNPQLENMPQIDGDGFTKLKMTQPKRARARKDGLEYDVFVFRTAITPSKAGRLTVGAARLAFAVQLRGSMIDDFFNPFGRRRAKEVEVKTEPVELDVQPLPAAGRPNDFSGAIGSFRLTAEGSPTRVKIGDPVTMKLKISGRGNFDRVNAPALKDPSGWHTYPAAGEFSNDDELGFSGAKSFELAVIPETKKTAMPVFTFSYFDPATGKYATLNSEPAPLQVEGSVPPAAPGVGAASEFPAAQPAKPAPSATPAVTDILGLRYDFGRPHTTFDPLHLRRSFQLTQFIPAAVLLALLALRLRRRDPAAERVARLRREKAELWPRLRAGAPDAEFFETATRLVQLETAIRTGQPEASIDLATAIESRPLDRETAAAIEEIFNSRAELLYAGTARGDGAAQRGERERLIKAVRRFEKGRSDV